MGSEQPGRPLSRDGVNARSRLYRRGRPSSVEDDGHARARTLASVSDRPRPRFQANTPSPKAPQKSVLESEDKPRRVCRGGVMLNRRFVGLALVLCPAVISSMLSTISLPAAAADADPGILDFPDSSGHAQTLNINGPLDLDNPFFQDLGTNGRRCVTCHQPNAAWTITPANLEQRFHESRGADPIFTNNDGSDCEGATPHSLGETRAAYQLLLTRGLIRVGLDVPPGAEFFIESVDDPNHCGPATNDASLYRRPLPSTNLGFLTAVMWDGRESSPTTTILQDLAHQANDATRGHAKGAQDISAAQAEQIVAFETGLFTA